MEKFRLWRGIKYTVYPTGYVYDAQQRFVRIIDEEPVMRCVQILLGRNKPKTKNRETLDQMIEGYPESFFEMLGIKK